MTRYGTKDCTCPDVITGTGGKRPEKCGCGNRFQTEAELRNAGVGAARDGDHNGPGFLRSFTGSRGVDSSASQAGRRLDPGKAISAAAIALESQKAQVDKEPRRRSLKRGRGFAVAKAQRDKVKLLPCAYCGRDGDDLYVLIDPAHLWPRGKGGCDDPLCVVPLCREHHQAFDLGSLELLPSLVSRGYFPEMAHAITHGVSPTELVRRLTTERSPIRRAEGRA